MSDETPTTDAEPAGEPAEAAEPGAVATTATATLESPAHHGPPPEPVTFRGKFLAPLVMPIAVVAVIVFYVLNVSRVFLAAEGSLAVGYAATVTVLILGGGTALAAAPKLRSSSLTLILGGGLLVLMMAGLISIGAASPKGASGPTQCAPVAQKLTIDAGGGNALKFTPNTPTVKAGCIQITFNILDGTHTLQFDDPVAANAFQQLSVNDKVWAGTLPVGKYVFHCTTPGHATAGMVGTLTVTA